MDLAPGTVIAGKFRLGHPLAQGGMGSVWVAFNTQLEVPVALKFMAPSLVGSADLVGRFEREAKAAAQLRHPHVVQVFEHGVDRGIPFIAMELLEGEDLGSRLRARGRLSLQETSRLVTDVCKALRRAHDMGLVHRDLKPANIFLSRHDDDELVKVLDFGIAKSISPSAKDDATKTGAIVGSPHYMSPEQARRGSRPVDHRADLWSLGVIAFRCLTGRLPFEGDNLIEVLVRVCTDPIPPPSSLAPDLDPRLDPFFVRALARNPDERFHSAREMADTLAGLTAPPARDRPPPLDRSWSDVRPAATARMETRAPGRASHPGPSSDAFPPSAAIEPDPFDVATTLPLAHPAAQRALAGQPWAAAVQTAATTAPLPRNVTAPMPPGPHAPAASTAQAPTFRAPAPSQDPLPRVVLSAAPPPPAPPTASDPTPLMQAGGTITSAGAELSTPAPARNKSSGEDRSWIALAAIVAAILVVGLLVGSVLLARGATGEATANGKDSTGVPEPSAPASSDAPAQVPSAAPAPSTAEPRAPAVPSSSEAAPVSTAAPSDGSAGTSTPRPAAAATPSTTATGQGKGTAKPRKPPSSFLVDTPGF